MKLREVILNERNKAVTPESVTMWFKRNRIVYEKLKKEVVVIELDKDEVSETIFQNGTFEELPSVKKWIKDMTLRKARGDSIKNFVRILKNVCRGQIGHIRIKGWTLKHPDRLTIEQAKDHLYEREKAGYKGTRNYRLALRSFFTSRKVVVNSSDISGKMEEYGQYSDMYVPKKKIYQIFDFLKTINEQAYLASKFMYKTATRVSATLRAKKSNINREEHTIAIYDKGTNGNRKKCVKLIPEDLWRELQLEEKEGKLFKIKIQELNAFLRSAYERVIPELNKRIPQPSHFWRHQFAQHMLRASNWNYGLVASLGGWSLEALRRYYGMPSQAVVKQFGLEHLPNI